MSGGCDPGYDINYPLDHEDWLVYDIETEGMNPNPPVIRVIGRGTAASKLSMLSAVQVYRHDTVLFVEELLGKELTGPQKNLLSLSAIKLPSGKPVKKNRGPKPYRNFPVQR